MNLRNVGPVGALALALWIGGGALVSHAHQANNNGGLAGCNIAVVDMNRVYNASDAPRQLDAKAAEYETEASQQLKKIVDARYLDINELKEFGTLLNIASPTDPDKARIQALQTTAQQRADELRMLQTKQNPNAAETKRLNELTQLGRLMDQVLPEIRDSLLQTQSARVAAFRQEQIARLREVVGKIAKAKGFAHVFEANALVYSVNDLTADTLQQVAKHK